MKHFVEWAHIREAPEDLLERLRAIEATAELLWWGPRPADVEDENGRTVTIVAPVWLVGTVRPNGVRRRAGAHLLEKQEKLGPRGDRDTWRIGRLYYQSFAPVAFYPLADPSAAIVEDFRRRDWALRHQLSVAERRFLDEAEGIPGLELRQRQARDYAEGEGPSVWRFVYRRPKSVVVN